MEAKRSNVKLKLKQNHKNAQPKDIHIFLVFILTHFFYSHTHNFSSYSQNLFFSNSCRFCVQSKAVSTQTITGIAIVVDDKNIEDEKK